MEVKQSYIAYIIPDTFESYSVIAETSKATYDIDASGNFLHIPVEIGYGEKVSNKIKVSVKHVQENSKFTAQPFCIWSPVPEYRSTMQHIKIWTVAGTGKNIFTENKVNWLGSTSIENITLDLSADIEGISLDKTLPHRLHRNTWQYKSNSWFIGLKCYPYKLAQADSVQSITYRIADNIDYFHHGNQEKYNFLKADDKIFPSQRILFVKKIQSIHDWLYCFKILKHYYNFNADS